MRRIVSDVCAQVPAAIALGVAAGPDLNRDARLRVRRQQRRLGGDLTEKQKERLVKTIRHYMGEVNQALPQAAVQLINKCLPLTLRWLLKL
jgi:hypothetical protein